MGGADSLMGALMLVVPALVVVRVSVGGLLCGFLLFHGKAR